MNKNIVSESLNEIEVNLKNLIQDFKIINNPEIDIIFKNIEIAKAQLIEVKEIDNKYLDAVKHMSLTNLDNEFGYKGFNHAITVFKIFFQNSRNTINIFHKDLNDPIFNDDEFLFNLELHLMSKPLNLVIQTMKRNPSKALDLILKYEKNNKNIVVYQSTDKFISEVKKLFELDKKYNFIVSGTAFILETDSENLRGLCNFKDKELSTKLNKLFLFR